MSEKEEKKEIPDFNVPSVAAGLRTLDQINSGTKNPLISSRPTSLITSLDGDDDLDRLYKYVDSKLAPNRLFHERVWEGIIIRNDTGVLGEETRATLASCAMEGAARNAQVEMGVVRVFIPELHTHLPNPQTMPKWDGDSEEDGWETDMAMAELYPRCYAPAEYLRSLANESSVEWSDVKVRFNVPGNYSEGVLVVPTEAPLSKTEGVDPGKSKRKPLKEKAGKPRKWGNKLDDTSPLVNLNKVGKQMLALPPPKPRPSCKKGGKAPNSKGDYHTSVDKELLKYESALGPVDWTGCGGWGTLAQAPGKPAKGRKKHYLEKNSPHLVELPPEYCKPYSKWDKKLKKRITYKRRMLIHKAALEPFMRMVDQARADGIPYPILCAYSTYRSLAQQRRSFNFYLRTKYNGNVAKCQRYVSNPDRRDRQPPGGDHYCGRGIDIFLGVDQNAWSDAHQRKHKSNRGDANAAFKRYMHKQNIMKWLLQNAEFYGLYNWTREPWHWAYNPDDREGRRDSIEELENT